MLGRGMLKGLWVTLQHTISSFTSGPRRFPKRYLDGPVPRPEPSTQGMLTLQYPFEKYEMWPRFRGVLVHLRDPETGQSRCTACMACVRACPHGVLTVTGEGKGRERRAKTYTYELGRCIFCRLCVESCRFDAIEMGQEYEFVSTTQDQTLNLEEMLALGGRSGIKHTGEAWGQVE